MATEGKVVTLVCTAFQHQQSQFILLGKDKVRHGLHLLFVVRRLGVEIHVHAHAVAQSGCAFQRVVGIGQTRVVELHHILFLRPLVALRVADNLVVGLFPDGNHVFLPVPAELY